MQIIKTCISLDANHYNESWIKMNIEENNNKYII